MNRNGGINDKFAVGTRRAMAVYLNRVHLIDSLKMIKLPRRSADMRKSPAKWTCGANSARNCSNTEPCCWASPLSQERQHLPNCTGKTRSTCGDLSLNSERFLELAMWLAGNLTIVHRQDWLFCKYGEIGHSWPTCTRRMRHQQPCQSMICAAWTAGGCKCANSTCAKGYNPYCTSVLHSQLRLDGTLVHHNPVLYNSSVPGPQFDPLRTLHHRAVVRAAFGRAGSRVTSRPAGRIVNHPSLLGFKEERHLSNHHAAWDGHRRKGGNDTFRPIKGYQQVQARRR